MPLELARRGIRVNVLAPGITATPLVERLRGTASEVAHSDELIARRIPMAGSARRQRSRV